MYAVLFPFWHLFTVKHSLHLEGFFFFFFFLRGMFNISSSAVLLVVMHNLSMKKQNISIQYACCNSFGETVGWIFLHFVLYWVCFITLCCLICTVYARVLIVEIKRSPRWSRSTDWNVYSFDFLLIFKKKTLSGAFLHFCRNCTNSKSSNNK